MNYRTLGRTGLKVSELCLGTVTFGANFYGIAVVDQTKANQMVARAIKAGINFFDTADVYSYGQSEPVLGAAMKATALNRASLAASLIGLRTLVAMTLLTSPVPFVAGCHHLAIAALS